DFPGDGAPEPFGFDVAGFVSDRFGIFVGDEGPGRLFEQPRNFSDVVPIAYEAVAADPALFLQVSEFVIARGGRPLGQVFARLRQPVSGRCAAGPSASVERDAKNELARRNSRL